MDWKLCFQSSFRRHAGDDIDDPEPAMIDDSHLGDGPHVLDDESRLPVSVALLVCLLYIALEALADFYMEGWPYQDALYYVFISLTTIGKLYLFRPHMQTRILGTFTGDKVSEFWR